MAMLPFGNSNGLSPDGTRIYILVAAFYFLTPPSSFCHSVDQQQNAYVYSLSLSLSLSLSFTKHKLGKTTTRKRIERDSYSVLSSY